MATRIPSVGITYDRMSHKTATGSISPPSKRACGRFGDAGHISKSNIRLHLRIRESIRRKRIPKLIYAAIRR
jgi:hypothetical protein